MCRKGGEGCSGGGSGLFVVLVRDEKRGEKSVLNDGNVCERHESHSFTLNVSERYVGDSFIMNVTEKYESDSFIMNVLERYTSDSFILNAWLYFLKVIHSFTMYSCIL